jgi:hypothetical protein
VITNYLKTAVQPTPKITWISNVPQKMNNEQHNKPLSKIFRTWWSRKTVSLRKPDQSTVKQRWKNLHEIDMEHNGKNCDLHQQMKEERDLVTSGVRDKCCLTLKAIRFIWQLGELPRDSISRDNTSNLCVWSVPSHLSAIIHAMAWCLSCTHYPLAQLHQWHQQWHMPKQQVLGRIACFPWYDKGHIENATNNSSIVACVFVTVVTFLPSRCLATIRGFLPSRCLATIRYLYRVVA